MRKIIALMLLISTPALAAYCRQGPVPETDQGVRTVHIWPGSDWEGQWTGGPTETKPFPSISIQTRYQGDVQDPVLLEERATDMQEGLKTHLNPKTGHIRKLTLIKNHKMVMEWEITGNPEACRIENYLEENLTKVFDQDNKLRYTRPANYRGLLVTFDPQTGDTAMTTEINGYTKAMVTDQIIITKNGWETVYGKDKAILSRIRYRYNTQEGANGKP